MALNKGTTMTIKELIAQLQEYDPTFPVFLEGCDCWEAARGVIPALSEGPRHPFAPHEGVIITRWEEYLEIKEW